MKIMLVTGYIDYETFGDHSNTAPISNGSVYDVSTPELDKIAKIKSLRNDFTEYLEDYEDYFQSRLVSPKEPSFTVSELKNSNMVNKQVEKYENELKKYKVELLSAKEKDAVISDLISLNPAGISSYAKDVNVTILNDLFDKISNAAAEEAVERVYYFEVQ